jgi:mono/diheme cytochrome c family protein
MATLSGTRLRRVLAPAAPFLACLLSGCGSDHYPAELRYPLRTDWLVVTKPSPETWDQPRPGQLDEELARIKDLRDAEVLDPNKVPAGDRRELTEALDKVFGTPADPSVKGSEEDEEAVEHLRLGKEHLRSGSSLYRRHCLHCHGLTGDGRGPTGPWLFPHPRDYRQGVFKFLSTASRGVAERKPRRADLIRTLQNGIDGTSMPSFRVLPDEQLQDLVSYVIHLSLRGQVEYDTMRTYLQRGKDALEDEDIGTHVQKQAGLFLKRWDESNTAPPIAPQRYKFNESNERQRHASIKRGYEVFVKSEGGGGCISCHIDYGRQVPFRYDQWGTLTRPANLTVPVYRGGRRPVDLYWRVRGGIPPADMPVNNSLTDEQVWDLVTFIRNLPYPAMLPEDIRKDVYERRDATKGGGEHAAR